MKSQVAVIAILVLIVASSVSYYAGESLNGSTKSVTETSTSTTISTLLPPATTTTQFLTSSVTSTITSTTTSTSTSTLTSTLTETGAGTTFTTTATSSRTVYVQASTSGSRDASCLLPVPSNATMTFIRTSSFSGTMVTYANGLTEVFLEYSCRQPISNDTYNYGPSPRVTFYQFAMAAVTNQTFIHDENGSVYLYSQPGSRPLSSMGTDYTVVGNGGQYFELIFYHYTDSSENWCGDPNQSAKIISSGVSVQFFGPFTGTWQLSRPTIRVLNPGDIYQANSCLRTG